MYDGYTQVQKKAATWTWVSALDCRVPFTGQGTRVNVPRANGVEVEEMGSHYSLWDLSPCRGLSA